MDSTFKKGLDYTGITVIFWCHDGNGKYVLAKRSQQARDEQGRWDCGGGGLEFNDQVLERLKTEVREEYGAEALAVEFLGYRDVHREKDGKAYHWLALDFKVKVDPAEVRICEPHKFDELGWFSLDQLPQPLHSQLPFALEQYKGKL